MFYVIGSGPSGIACALGLLERGLPVTVLDYGNDLEPQLRAVADRMGASEPSEWTAEDRGVLKRAAYSDFSGIPLKPAYGSFFPYRGDEELLAVERDGIDLLPSFAKGGLSNVWGAAILPYHSSDLEGWPIAMESLAPHYRAVLKAIGPSLARDDLSRDFPLYAEEGRGLRLSSQMQALLGDLDARRGELSKRGITFGRARLAVKDEVGAGCRYCGLCLYGCPYRLIFNSGDLLA